MRRPSVLRTSPSCMPHHQANCIVRIIQYGQAAFHDHKLIAWSRWLSLQFETMGWSVGLAMLIDPSSRF